MMNHTMNLFSGVVKWETHELYRSVPRLLLVAGAAQAAGDVRNHGVAPLSVLETIGTVLAQP
jgi:hypothetical protein